MAKLEGRMTHPARADDATLAEYIESSRARLAHEYDTDDLLEFDRMVFEFRSRIEDADARVARAEAQVNEWKKAAQEWKKQALERDDD